ncbi:hypothetical protein Tco_1366566 [Tanacetum coccineum]
MEKNIDRDIDDSSPKLIKASREVYLDLNSPVLIDYEINRMYQLTNKEIQAHMEKQERMENDAQKARVIKLSKPELIKVVVEVASEAGADPKALHNMNGGKEFLKKHDVEFKVLQREHLEKLRKRDEQKKKRSDQYVWTTQNRLKPDRITNIFIHLNTRLVIIIVYKKNDPRNFDVHKNFKFGNFGISEWDELSIIIPKKRNKVVSKLMTSLSNKYKRLKEISGELGINPSLPLPRQDPSLPSSRKRKAV